jgi:hypothetical protein
LVFLFNNKVKHDYGSSRNLADQLSHHGHCWHQDPWDILSMRKGLIEALSVVFESGTREDVLTAQEIIGRLAARGHSEFAELGP